jgi:hypothetical protein
MGFHAPAFENVPAAHAEHAVADGLSIYEPRLQLEHVLRICVLSTDA